MVTQVPTAEVSCEIPQNRGGSGPKSFIDTPLYDFV